MAEGSHHTETLGLVYQLKQCSVITPFHKTRSTCPHLLMHKRHVQLRQLLLLALRWQFKGLILLLSRLGVIIIVTALPVRTDAALVTLLRPATFVAAVAEHARLPPLVPAVIAAAATAAAAAGVPAAAAAEVHAAPTGCCLRGPMLLLTSTGVTCFEWDVSATTRLALRAILQMDRAAQRRMGIFGVVPVPAPSASVVSPTRKQPVQRLRSVMQKCVTRKRMLTLGWMCFWVGWACMLNCSAKLHAQLLQSGQRAPALHLSRASRPSLAAAQHHSPPHPPGLGCRPPPACTRAVSGTPAGPARRLSLLPEYNALKRVHRPGLAGHARGRSQKCACMQRTSNTDGKEKCRKCTLGKAHLLVAARHFCSVLQNIQRERPSNRCVVNKPSLQPSQVDTALQNHAAAAPAAAVLPRPRRETLCQLVVARCHPNFPSQWCFARALPVCKRAEETATPDSREDYRRTATPHARHFAP